MGCCAAYRPAKYSWRRARRRGTAGSAPACRKCVPQLSRSGRPARPGGRRRCLHFRWSSSRLYDTTSATSARDAPCASARLNARAPKASSDRPNTSRYSATRKPAFVPPALGLEVLGRAQDNRLELLLRTAGCQKLQRATRPGRVHRAAQAASGKFPHLLDPVLGLASMPCTTWRRLTP